MLEIIMVYQEGAGRVTREWSLNDNEKLVKAIMGAVKRHNVVEEKPLNTESLDCARDDSLKARDDSLKAQDDSLKAQDDSEPEELPVFDPEAAIKQMEEEASAEDEEPEEEERKLYDGFLLVHCKGCGQTRAVCIKKPTDVFRCKCGEETELEDMVWAVFQCPCCGKRWKYRTNETADPLVATCLECGAEMQAWWNKRKRKYEYVK